MLLDSHAGRGYGRRRGAGKGLTAPLACLALLASAPAAAQTDPRDASAARLPCGARLTVLSAPAPEGIEPRVHGILLFSAGTIHERPHEIGAAPVLARALRGGGSLLTGPDALERWLGERGASLEIAALPAELVLRFTCAPDDLRAMLEHLRGLIVAPAYPEPAVHAAREQEIAGLRAREAGRVGEVERALEARALADSPWTRAASGEEIAAVTRARILSFHRTNLGLDRLAVALAGDVAAEGLAEWLDPLLASIGRAGKPVKLEPPQRAPAPPGLIWLVPAPEEERAQLRVAFPVDVQGPADEAALQVWSEIYALAGEGGDTGGESLRLTPLGMSLVERARMWTAATDCPGAAAPQTLRTLLRVVTRGAVPAVSRESFEAARRGVLARNASLPLEVSLLAAARAALWELREERRDELERELRDLTPERLRAVLERVLPGTGHVMVVRGPLALEAPLAALELELEVPTEPLRRAPETGGNLGRPRRPVQARVVYHSAPRRPLGTPAGVELRARMIAALGGSDAWASLAALQQEGEVRVQGLDTPVAASIVRDLRGRRLRLDQRGPDGWTSQVVSREQAFSFAATRFNPLSEPLHQRTLYRERRQLAQVLHDLCAEPDLSVDVDDQGRLVVRQGDTRLCWIAVGREGLPQQLGYDGPGASERSVYTYGDWRPVAGSRILLPFQIEQPTEGVRFTWTKQAALLDLDEGLFKRPGR